MQPFVWKSKLKKEGKSLDELDVMKMKKNNMEESRVMLLFCLHIGKSADFH